MKRNIDKILPASRRNKKEMTERPITHRPKDCSDKEYQQAELDAVKAPEVLNSAQTVLAGRINNVEELNQFCDALTIHFIECGKPMYFIMTADESKAKTSSHFQKLDQELQTYKISEAKQKKLNAEADLIEADDFFELDLATATEEEEMKADNVRPKPSTPYNLDNRAANLVRNGGATTAWDQLQKQGNRKAPDWESSEWCDGIIEVDTETVWWRCLSCGLVGPYLLADHRRTRKITS